MAKESKKITERMVQQDIVVFLRELGFSVIPTSGAEKTAPGMRGFPDLIVFAPNFFWLIEVKAPGGKLRETQQKFFEKHKENLHHRGLIVDSFETIREEVRQLMVVDWGQTSLAYIIENHIPFNKRKESKGEDSH